MTDEKTPNGDEPEVDGEQTTSPEPPPPPPADPPPTDPPPPPPPPSPPPPPPPAYEEPRLRLARRTENKVIAGVCSGIAAYLGLDPVLVRVGTVLLGLLTGGTAILAYIVAWLVMPVARPDEPVAEPRGDLNVGQWVAVGAIAFGALILFTDIWHIRRPILIGLVLIGVGIAFWGRDFSAGPRRPKPPTPPAPTPPSSPLTAQHGWESGDAPTTPLPSSSPPSPPPPPTTPLPPYSRGAAASTVPPSPRHPRGRDPRGSSMLGRLVIGAAALAVATGLIIENIWFDIPAEVYLAVLLGIVGVGLVIGAWIGRARWLIFVGLGLTLCLMTASWVPSNGRFGDVSWNPVSLRQIDDEEPYRTTAGDAVLDLSDVDFTRARSIDVRLGFGELLIIVPDEADAEVVARVQGGEMDIFGQRNEGWDVRQTVYDSGSEGDGPVRIEARVTFGELTVRRERAGDGTFDLPDPNDNRFDFDFQTPPSDRLPRLRDR